MLVGLIELASTYGASPLLRRSKRFLGCARGFLLRLLGLLGHLDWRIGLRVGWHDE
jgi:hypothetical protein